MYTYSLDILVLPVGGLVTEDPATLHSRLHVDVINMQPHAVHSVPLVFLRNGGSCGEDQKPSWRPKRLKRLTVP